MLIGDVPIRDWVNEGCLAEKQFAKHDDSDPPIYIWDNRAFMYRPELIITQKLRMSTKALRGLVLRWCRRRVWRSFQSYLRRTYGEDWSSIRDSTHNRKRKRDDAGDPSNNRRAKALDRDLEAGRDVIGRIADGDWWSWSCGSRLLFWKWQAEVTQDARDGAPFWVTGRLPRNQKPQRPPLDKRMAKFPAKKINKVRSRGHITPGFVRSLTNYFPVEKVVEDGEVLDVRMVYDATQSGLNDVLWAPNFGLPTVRSHMRMISFESEMADLDMGEMFLNFPLDPKIQPYAGVDLSPLAKDMGITLKQGEHLWERWNRLAMGMRPSPFMAIRLFWLAEEIVRGDRRDPENYLRWNHIRMNLPGSKSYDPTLPWMCKIVVHNGYYLVAADFITFVDDIRSGGPGREWTWRATRQIAARLNSLGIQDAPRKRRPPSKRPDAWAGSMVEVTDENEVANRVTQAKWEKGKQTLQRMLEDVRTSKDGSTDLKQLLSDRGFLVHLVGSYECMVPYLKGIHQTADGWRPDRDKDGWKMSSREWLQYTEWCLSRGEGDPRLPTEEGAPARVKFTSLFEPHVRALLKLMEGDTPRKQVWRSKKIVYVMYGFGDASGGGFGSTWTRREQDGIQLRIGVWQCGELEESSNWKEAENIVESLEAAGEQGELDDAEIFFCTDNEVMESTFYAGTSSSPKLFALVLRLRVLEMKYRMRLVISHVSGTRMIAQATDGVSRGNIEGGVLEGASMTSFIPFNETALERSPGLEDWMKSWLAPDATVLTPADWFELGHDIRG